MNPYEKIIKQMRTQGAYKNQKVLQIAVMRSSNSCRVGDLFLEKDDLMCASHLVDDLKAEDIVLVQRLSEEKYAIVERVVDFA